MSGLTYEAIAARALTDDCYKQGLLDAAAVAKAQGQDKTIPPCPSTIAAMYIESLARGEMP